MNKGGMIVERTSGKGRLVRTLLWSLVLAGLVSTAVLLILAFVMLKMQWDVEKTETAILFVYVLSCFAGGWYCGRKMEKRKFVWGLLIGVLYFLLLLLISQTGGAAGETDFMQGVLAFALCAGGGMLGGMLAG